MRDRPDAAAALHWPQQGGHAPSGQPAAQAQWGARLLPQQAGTAGGGGGAAMAEDEGLVSVDYEVSGKVQGVFFRKYTQVRAAVPRGGLPCLPACAVPSISPVQAPWRGLAAGGRGRGRGQGLSSGCCC